MLSNAENAARRDKRKLKRRHLIYYLRVFIRGTDQVLGHLVDLTSEGVMIINEKPVELQKSFHLSMALPEEISSKAHIDFEAESIWCRKDINPDFFDTGFRLTQINPDDMEIITHLIEDFGFND
jgi:hypothetical protein